MWTVKFQGPQACRANRSADSATSPHPTRQLSNQCSTSPRPGESPAEKEEPGTAQLGSENKPTGQARKHGQRPCRPASRGRRREGHTAVLFSPESVQAGWKQVRIPDLGPSESPVPLSSMSSFISQSISCKISYSVPTVMICSASDLGQEIRDDR